MSTFNPDQYTLPFAITNTTHRQPYPFIAADKPEKTSQTRKIIIITGAGSGIGAAATQIWARAGAQGIVVVGRRIEKLDKIEKEMLVIHSTVKILKSKTDISSEEDVKQLYSDIQNTYGRGADVLLNGAGAVNDGKLITEQSVDEWWRVMDVNLRGLLSMVHHYIISQPDPKAPVGTIISIASGRAGLVNSGGSSYNVSKIAGQRFLEHVHSEYPTLRTFSTMPDIVATDMSADSAFWRPYAGIHVGLTGLQALYLVQPRADF